MTFDGSVTEEDKRLYDYLVVCPFCGTDTVVVETTTFPVTEEVLKTIHARQF